MGGKYMMGVPKAFRAAAGIEAGDNIVVTMELDAEPRTVETPPDLEKALKQSGLQAAWEKLSYTHRKEHVLAIEESKKAETRARRIGKAIEMIAATVK